MKQHLKDKNTIHRPKLSMLNASFCVGIAAISPFTSSAATITVNTNSGRFNVPGCTLTEAIFSANKPENQGHGCETGSATGTDTIVFSSNLAFPNNTISPGYSVFLRNKNIVIDGSTVSGGITIDAENRIRPLTILNSKVTLNNLRLINGGEGGYGGSGINIYDRQVGYFTNSEVTLNNCALINNTNLGGDSGVGNGGGIYIQDDAAIKVYNTTISNNTATADGGGIHAKDNAKVTIGNSNITNNTTIYNNNSGFGGGISLADNATIDIVNTTVAYNSASRGGAINHAGDAVTLERVTVSGNTAMINGSGIRTATNAISLNMTNSTLSKNTSPRASAVFVIGDGTTVDISSSTISGNSVTDDGLNSDGSNTAGIVALNGRVNLVNTIVANSIGGGDCFRRASNNVSIDSFSIVEDGSCGASRSGDPGLMPLRSNGGSTRTHELNENSIALDTADSSKCSSIDQRGLARDENCDVGSFELNEEDLIEGESDFYVVPTKDGTTVIFNL